MTKVQTLTLEMSEKRQRLNELLDKDGATLATEERAEMGALTGRLQELEPELRASIVAEGTEQRNHEPDAALAALVARVRRVADLRGRGRASERGRRGSRAARAPGPVRQSDPRGAAGTPGP